MYKGHMMLYERYRRLSLWNKLGVWGSLASILGLLLSIVLYLIEPNQFNPPPSASLRAKLIECIKELDVIEKSWNSEYSRVEPLADRVTSLLGSRYPKSASVINKVRMSSPTAKEIARTVRREVQKVLDQLDVENRP